MNKKKNIEIQNKTFFIALLIGVIGLAYITVRPVLSLVIMAILIVNLFNPVYKRILKSVKGNVSLASSLSTFVVLLSVIIPVFLIGVFSINQANVFRQDIEEFIGRSIVEEENTNQETLQEGIVINNSTGELSVSVQDSSGSNSIGDLDVQQTLDAFNEVLQTLPFLENEEITIEQARNAVSDLAGPAAEFTFNQGISFASSIPIFSTYLILFITLVGTLFPAQATIKDLVSRLSPLDNEIDQIYIKKTLAMADSMIKGTFVIAIVQGSISGILLWIAGVEYVFFWTILSIFFSVIPVGAGIINLPIAIVLLLTGNIPGALVVILGNILIVSTVDNVLRPHLVSKDAQLSSALILIGVIGGIQAFGFLGFIFGPIVMILLSTTFDIYQKYYKIEK